MSETIRVPWRVGMPVEASPAAPARARGRVEQCSRKLAQVEADAARIAARRDELPADREAHRMHLDRVLDFQQKRAQWLRSAGRMADAALENRAAQLEAELGPAVAYLEDGLPAEYHEDIRLVWLLGELALVRYALEAVEEVS